MTLGPRRAGLGAHLAFAVVPLVPALTSRQSGRAPFLASFAESIACCQSSKSRGQKLFVGSSSGIITGGTGKYAGASGSHTVSSSGVVLSLPSAGFGAFGAFSGTTTGTLTTP
jgi:hypothetical protein